MMVLAILLERTSPTRSLRFPRTTTVVSDISKSGGLLLAQKRHLGFDSGDVPAQVAQARRFFQLPAGLLQSQVESFLAEVPPFGGQFRQSQIFQFGRFHIARRPP